MAISEITQTLLAAKKAKGVTYEELEKIVGQDEVWIASVIFRQASADMDQAKALVEALGLSADMAEPLTVPPLKGSLEPVIPTDPLIYRLYEIMQVYGMPVKDVVHEKFGDGIMSAIDFSMHIDKEENPAGDRVVITMNGKFLPYRSW